MRNHLSPHKVIPSTLYYLALHQTLLEHQKYLWRFSVDSYDQMIEASSYHQRKTKHNPTLIWKIFHGWIVIDYYSTNRISFLTGGGYDKPQFTTKRLLGLVPKYLMVSMLLHWRTMCGKDKFNPKTNSVFFYLFFYLNK